MVHRGKRSREATHRRLNRRQSKKGHARVRNFVSRLLSKEGHRDFEKGESINVLTGFEIDLAVRSEFGVSLPEIYMEHERAEVISDTRGKGTLQRVGLDG